MFGLKAVSLERLAEYDFNISNSMGQILLSNSPVRSLGRLQDLSQIIFQADSVVNALLQSKEMVFLSERRNLIVHRNGIADERYLSKTRDPLL